MCLIGIGVRDHSPMPMRCYRKKMRPASVRITFIMVHHPDSGRKTRISPIETRGCGWIADPVSQWKRTRLHKPQGQPFVNTDGSLPEIDAPKSHLDDKRFAAT